MACGTPAIVADVGGMGDLVREIGGGVAIRCDQPEVFAAHIRYLVAIPEQYSKLSASGVAGSRHYTWDEIARQTYNVYKDILKRGTQSRTVGS